MRRIAGFLGVLLLLAALAVYATDPAESGPRVLGQLWYDLHPGSLNLTQAIIERYIWAPLWDPAILSVLQLPAVLVFAVPGFVLVALALIAGWRRRRRFIFFK